MNELEVPGVCPWVTVGLSSSTLVILEGPLGAVAPTFADCVRNCSTCRAKLRNPVNCLSRNFCLSLIHDAETFNQVEQP